MAFFFFFFFAESPSPENLDSDEQNHLPHYLLAFIEFSATVEKS